MGQWENPKMCNSFHSVWINSAHFAKFLMLTFSKGCCSHNCTSFNFSQSVEKACNPAAGKYRPLLFVVICQILTYMALWRKLSYLSYIAIIHKAILVSCGNRSSRTLRPMGLLFSTERVTCVPCNGNDILKMTSFWKTIVLYLQFM